jgi:hypothetical protein
VQGLIAEALEMASGDELPGDVDPVEVVRATVAPLYYRLFISRADRRADRRPPTARPTPPWPRRARVPSAGEDRALGDRRTRTVDADQLTSYIPRTGSDR